MPLLLRIVLLCVLWIVAYHGLRPFVDRTMSADGRPLFNTAIDFMLACTVVVAASLFGQPTALRVLSELVAIGVMLALTLGLAWCSAVSHWGGA